MTRYLKYKLIISPVNYIFENYYSDSSKINIDAETIRNHDKCVLNIKTVCLQIKKTLLLMTRYLKYKLIISPVNYIFENYYSDSSKINIDAETIRNHDKCVFQINHMLGTRILDLDKPFRPADLLLINGYFSGYFINFEMNLNINQFNEEYNKNHIIHSDNVKAFNRYLEDYLV